MHGLEIETVFGYWQATADGGLVQVAGQVGRDEQGRPVGGELQQDHGQVVANLRSVLGKMGAGIDDLVAVQVNSTIGDWDELATLSRGAFGDVHPSGTVIGVRALNDPRYRLEISATARAPTTAGGGSMDARLPAASPIEEAFGFSRGVRVGHHVFVSGQMATDADGRIAHPRDVVAQFRRALENVAAALRGLDANMDDIVRTYTFLVGDLATEDFNAFCDVHRTSFRGPNRPTGTMVYVPRLPLDGALVQVDAGAYSRRDPEPAGGSRLDT